MKYEFSDLKEGRILVFKNGRYGIISYQNPNDKVYHTGKILACMFNDGEWDNLENIINLNFDLYKSEYPLYSFLNLISHNDINWIIEYRYLKPVCKTISVSFEEAVKAHSSNKTIYCLYNDKKNIYVPNSSGLLINNYGFPITSREISNGKWYIE